METKWSLFFYIKCFYPLKLILNFFAAVLNFFGGHFEFFCGFLVYSWSCGNKVVFVFLYKIFFPPKPHFESFLRPFWIFLRLFWIFFAESWFTHKAVETKWSSFFHKWLQSALKVCGGGGGWVVGVWQTPIIIITLHLIALY